MDKRQFLSFLGSGDFASLFIEAGWNRPASNIPFSCEIGAENKSFVFKEIAELYVRVLV
ncbi:MAG: Spc97/Spc98 family protein [Lentisphaeria bacterium]|nr:Spc97/Spc98 family protein [Lentisphaeria bacterium]